MKYDTCDTALLDAFLDGALAPEEEAALQAHLDICPDCQAYRDAVLAIRDAFPTAEETEVPPGFADGVMAAIRLDSRKKRKTHWGRVLAPLAACLALVVALRVAPWQGSTSGTADLMTTDRAAAPAADNGALRADSSPAEGGEIAQDAQIESAPYDAPQAQMSYTADPYDALVYLTEEDAGTLLDEYASFPYEDGAVSGTAYELTGPEYAALSSELSVPAEEISPEANLILVVVTP